MCQTSPGHRAWQVHCTLDPLARSTHSGQFSNCTVCGAHLGQSITMPHGQRPTPAICSTALEQMPCVLDLACRGDDRGSAWGSVGLIQPGDQPCTTNLAVGPDTLATPLPYTTMPYGLSPTSVVSFALTRPYAPIPSAKAERSKKVQILVKCGHREVQEQLDCRLPPFPPSSRFI